MALEWRYSEVTRESLGVTQYYGSGHTAIDFNGHGELWRGKELCAGYSGVVVTATTRSDRGRYVEIQVSTDEDVYIIGFCHLEYINVSVGQSVSRETVIGGMGDSGESYGVHCHYYAVQYGSRVNPYRLLFNEISQGGNPTGDEYFVNSEEQHGTYHFTADKKIPVYPSLEDAIADRNVVATYTSGEQVDYDSIYNTCLFRYISYIGSSGNRNFIAVRNLQTGFTVGWAE